MITGELFVSKKSCKNDMESETQPCSKTWASSWAEKLLFVSMIAAANFSDGFEPQKQFPAGENRHNNKALTTT